VTAAIQGQRIENISVSPDDATHCPVVALDHSSTKGKRVNATLLPFKAVQSFIFLVS
jgi:hypothetical protein